ncbi:hypothetical protein ACN47E_002598 [Coniothyrium glycines]
MAGIAARLARNTGWTYAAGLWKEYFCPRLTWFRARRRGAGHPCKAPWRTTASTYSGNNVRESTCRMLPKDDLEISTLAIQEKTRGSFGQVRARSPPTLWRCIPEVVCARGPHPGANLHCTKQKGRWEIVPRRAGARQSRAKPRPCVCGARGKAP